MRQKTSRRPPSPPLPPTLRLALHELAQPEAMPLADRIAFSRMKYGDPEAVALLADQLASHMLGHAELGAAVDAHGSLWIGSAAYGDTPSAAAHLSAAVAGRLRAAGWPVQAFKIDREGGFERTDFGALGRAARKRAMTHRKISLTPAVAASLQGQLAVVIDDLRCTGTHEQAVARLLAQTGVAAMAFVYCIRFGGAIRAAQEEALNHTWVRGLGELEGILAAPQSPLLNARMLKFLLEQPPVAVTALCAALPLPRVQALHAAALGRDGYYDMARFKAGFAALEEWLLSQGGIAGRGAPRSRAAQAGIVAALHMWERDGRFECTETGRDLSDWVRCYSRFKFGDVAAIQQMSRVLVQAAVARLEEGGSLREMFERAGARGEFVSLIAPGVRNVVSASNFLAREVGLRLNAWLTRRGLPTMVIRSLGRLSSGRANYAELSAEERLDRDKTTQTLIPRSEYQDFPSHVVFLDDVLVSGQTLQRNKALSLEAGARSFHALLAIMVDPEQARSDARIEHRLNQFVVQGGLDGEVAAILSHGDYQPVQRMLRLLLHPRNHAALPAFLQGQVPDHSLQRCYLAAMANDYLWIHAPQAGAKGEYAPSLELMERELVRRDLLGECLLQGV